MLSSLPAQFAITSSCQDDAAIIELHGELDLAAEEQLAAEFNKLLASDPAVVVVDLHELSFMDACGMRALIGLRGGCERQSKRFLLVRGPRAVQRVFALCDLERAFVFLDSAAESLSLLRADGSPAGTEGELRSRSALGIDEDRRPTVPIPRTGRTAPCAYATDRRQVR